MNCARALSQGSGALIVLVRDWKPEQLLPGLQEHGRVIQTSLSEELQAQLEDALAAARTEPQ
jgi:uncharacterized membrane protein